MTYAIIGSGKIGHALATQFARKGLEVMLANSRGPESILELAKALGPTVKASTASDALAADVVLLAIPFGAIPAATKDVPDWKDRLVIDASNAVEIPAFTPADLGGRLSTEIVAEAVPGARIVKAFNTIPAAKLESQTALSGGRRVVVLSGDDASARSQASHLIEQLGFAALDLGTLRQASHLQQFGGAMVALDLIKLA
jgi:predicted dinucleotide-binding enzyme